MNTTRISIIMPAYNEAAHLPALLDSIDVARARYAGDVEAIVADNGSTDATAAIARERGCVVAPVEKRAIAAARNGGAALATGEVLAFIDSDSRIHRETFNAIAQALARPDVIVGATGVVPSRWSAGIWTTWAVMTPMTWLAGVDAGVVFCRRADFHAVGGYDENLLCAEDVKFLFAMKKFGRTRGMRFHRPASVRAITSTRKFDKLGDWHFLLQMPVVGWRVLFNAKKNEEYVKRYWYEDR
ncbi:MAG: glycosyltransferase [Betaproteobacteria bacterium]|nr:glycosyltransferase [Betaproteobacteria bacterium]